MSRRVDPAPRVPGKTRLRHALECSVGANLVPPPTWAESIATWLSDKDGASPQYEITGSFPFDWMNGNVLTAKCKVKNARNKNQFIGLDILQLFNDACNNLNKMDNVASPNGWRYQHSGNSFTLTRRFAYEPPNDGREKSRYAARIFNALEDAALKLPLPDLNISIDFKGLKSTAKGHSGGVNDGGMA